MRKITPRSFHFYLCILHILILVVAIRAQDEYQQWREQEKEKINKFRKEQSESLREFVEEQDKRFAQFLAERWTKLEIMKGIIRDDTPKPDTLPVFIPEGERKKVSPDDKPLKRVAIPIPAVVPDEEPPRKPPKIPEIDNTSELSFDFYGSRILIQYDNKLTRRIQNPFNEEAISAHWLHLSSTRYQYLLHQIQYNRDVLKLDDWGFGVLVSSIGEKMYPSDNNNVVLFTWFVFLKSGYDAKIGFSDNRVFLLLPVENQLFGTPFYRFEEEETRYYLVPLRQGGGKQEPLFVYQGNYENASKRMKYDFSTLSRIGDNYIQRKPDFQYDDQSYRLSLIANQDLVELYRYHPIIDLGYYFTSSVDPTVNSTLLNELYTIIEGKSEIEAVDILLRFVQTTFQYETDHQHFGTEKYMVPDEILFYDYSDCEDRSILFAHLVDQLTGLPVIGLNYPGHVATAVRFNTDVDGDYIEYQEDRYIICDPTYINAPVGKSMPKYKIQNPDVIDFD